MEAQPEEKLLPARAVNAHVFCPRLFWLEHVEGIFIENEHTVEGTAVHKRVDKRGAKIDAPVEGDPPWQARAVWLSDATLGVTAKLDFIDERNDGTVIPVDTKKGVSANGELWLPDKVQLALQALLLQRSGYNVDTIAAYYVAERRRIYQPLCDETIELAELHVAAAQKTWRAEQAPAPLVDSKRCYGCSLNRVCLPDETHRLQALEDCSEPVPGTPIRRVLPPRFDTVPLYVETQGATVRLKGSEVEVWSRDKERLHQGGLDTIASVNLYGGVHITTPLLQALLDRDIPVCFFSSGGWYRGRTLPSLSRQVQVRINQYEAYGDERALLVARQLISDKIHNARVFIRRHDEDGEFRAELAELRERSREADSVASKESLLGIEGNAARTYWAAYSTLAAKKHEGFQMTGRTRRPPKDRVNAMLSYIYGMLTRDCALAVELVGFDPQLGLFHTPHHGRPSLALDMMEPFRTLVADSVVFGLIRRNEVEVNDFVCAGQEVYMKQAARRAVIRGYERRMDELVMHPIFGYSISYRRILQVQARLLARYLQGELATPPSFRTR